jgi:short subunit dehydrogenase-like uncharacterized protein
MADWLIYGATGYTGRLIAEKAASQGLRPVLAGRSRAVEAVATTLGLPSKVFDLGDAAATEAALAGVSLVLNCAGPFSATAAAMMAACVAARAHYLDITGEIAVFEHGHVLDAAARSAGIVICPGVGFDVVPTDCVALALHQAMPDATSLALGFDSRSPLSPGTAKTMVEGLGEGGYVRKGGQLTPVPLAYDVRRVDFGFGPKTAMTIPWGDVATAYYTTGIPDIACYIACPAKLAKASRRMNAFRWVFRARWVQALMKRRIDKRVTGPDATTRDGLRTAVWGEARNAKGEICEARIETANGYSLTVDSALAVVQRLLIGEPVAGGYYTPARLCGADLVKQLPGSGELVLKRVTAVS